MTLPRSTSMGVRRARDSLASLASWIAQNAQAIGPPYTSINDVVRASLDNTTRVAESLERPLSFGVVSISGTGGPWLVDAIANELVRGTSERGTENAILEIYRLLRYARSGNAASFRFVAHDASADGSGVSHRLELFSLWDVAAILSAAHHSGSAAADMRLSAERIRGACEAAEKSAVAWTVAGLSRNDVNELRDVVEARFAESRELGLLAASGYWERLGDLVEYLPESERADLLSLLWGSEANLTSAFRACSDALTALGHAGHVHCQTDALIERNARTGWFDRHPRCVLDQIMIEGLGASAQDVVTVLDRLGRAQPIARSALALLVRELVIPVQGLGWPGGGGAEIIEFPTPVDLDSGDLIASSSVTGGGKGMARTLRSVGYAKVVYLLERATRRLELAGLVVAVDPASERVDAFDYAIADWIAQTVGAEPVMRERSPEALLVVATKVDDPPSRTAHGSAAMMRWAEGLSQLVNQPAAGDAPWPREWTPGQAFANLYMFQHPSGVIDVTSGFEPARLPTSRIVTGRQMVQALRAARRGAELEDSEIELLEQHLAAPTAGAALIASRLQLIGTWQTRSRQVARRVAQIDAGVRARLVRHEPFGLMHEIEDWRLDVASILEHRLRMVAEAGRLGYLLQALMAREIELAVVLQRSFAESARKSDARVPPGSGLSREMISHVDAEDVELLSETALTDGAGACLSYWMTSLGRASRSPALASSLGTSRAVLAHVFDELAVGATRLGLHDEIVARLLALTPRPKSTSTSLVAAFAAASINDFVQRLDVIDNGRGGRGAAIASRQRSDPRGALMVPEIETLSIAKGWRIAFSALVNANIAAAREIQWIRKDAALSSILEAAPSNRMEFDL